MNTLTTKYQVGDLAWTNSSAFIKYETVNAVCNHCLGHGKLFNVIDEKIDCGQCGGVGTRRETTGGAIPVMVKVDQVIACQYNSGDWEVDYNCNLASEEDSYGYTTGDLQDDEMFDSYEAALEDQKGK